NLDPVAPQGEAQVREHPDIPDGCIPSVAFGPEMPGWGSWDWVGADLAEELAHCYRTTSYRPGELPVADVVVVIKHAPAHDWAEAVSQRAALVYCPVDYYGSAAAI